MEGRALVVNRRDTAARRHHFLAWPSGVVVSSQTPTVILALYFFLEDLAKNQSELPWDT